MTLRNGMMQSRPAVHVCSIDRTFAFFKEDFDNGNRSDSSRAVEGQLATLVFYSCTGFMSNEEADSRNIGF